MTSISNFVETSRNLRILSRSTYSLWHWMTASMNNEPIPVDIKGMQTSKAQLLILLSKEIDNSVLTKAGPQGSMVNTTILLIVGVSRTLYNQVYDLVTKGDIDLHINMKRLSPFSLVLSIRTHKLISHSSLAFQTIQADQHSQISAQAEIKKGYRLPNLQTGQVFQHQSNSSLVRFSQLSIA